MIPEDSRKNPEQPTMYIRSSTSNVHGNKLLDFTAPSPAACTSP